MLNIDREILASQSEHREVLLAEKQTYERIHTTTKTVLAEVGIETKNEAVIELLEATGLAGYDRTVGRIYLLPELIDHSLDSAAKSFAGDEGPNILGIGGIPPFLYRDTDQYPMPATYDELEHLVGVVGDSEIYGGILRQTNFGKE